MQPQLPAPANIVTNAAVAVTNAVAFAVALWHSASVDCAARPNALECRLTSTLHSLEWIAVALGALLAIVLVLAFVAVRRNLNKDLLNG